MTLDEILKSDQPYFGDFLIAKQGPYEDYLEHFTKLVHIANAARIGTGPLSIWEVGSWAGGSLAVWDKASGHSANFLVFDQWKPYHNDPHSEHHQAIDEAARSRDIERLFYHNVTKLGMAERVLIVLGNSNETLLKEPEQSADIVFIDGDHRYASVEADIRAAMPLVRADGILCGDDLQLQLPDINVLPRPLYDQYHKDLNDNRPNALLEGTFYHPGVTQAVGEIFGRVSTAAGRLWAMQKSTFGSDTEWKSVEF